MQRNATPHISFNDPDYPDVGFAASAYLRPGIGRPGMCASNRTAFSLSWLGIVSVSVDSFNKKFDRMTRSAVARWLKAGGPWRAPRHRAALLSAYMLRYEA